jgi:hypothetical protein
MKKYIMCFVAGCAVIVLLTILFGLLNRTALGPAISQQGSLIYLLVYGPSVYLVSRGSVLVIGWYF